MSRKIGSLLLILLLVVMAFFLIRQMRQATANPEAEVLTSPPDFVGWVLEVEPGGDQIKVESQADKIVRPVFVKLTKDTPIFRQEGDVLRPIGISEVHLQDQAELWLVGPIPSSFPAEVNVRQVIVEQLY